MEISIPVIWNAPSPTSNDRAAVFSQPGDADARWNGETHRHVIRGRDELRLSRTANADRTEDGVTDVGDDAAVFIEMQRENAKDIDHGQRVGALAVFQRLGQRVRIGMFEAFWLDLSRRRALRENRETELNRNDDIERSRARSWPILCVAGPASRCKSPCSCR